MRKYKLVVTDALGALVRRLARRTEVHPGSRPTQDTSIIMRMGKNVKVNNAVRKEVNVKIPIRIVGKNSQVFAKIKLLGEKAGKLTIGELIRLKKDRQ